MTVTYTFGLRPPMIGTYPDGYVPGSITVTDPPRQYDHGTIAYPEPLPYDRARHFDLTPAGPKVTKLVLAGDDYGTLPAVLHDGAEVAYDLAVGTTTPDQVVARLVDMAADYEVALDVEIVHPDGRTVTRSYDPAETTG